MGDDLVYSADDGLLGRELWRVPAGGVPALLGDLSPGAPSSSPSRLVEFQGAHWFTANDGVHGSELWRSDGTAAGTQLFADLTPGPVSTNVSQLTVAADRLFFVVGATLWASDGTVAGTTPLRTFFLRQPFPTLPSSLTAFAGKLVFAADDLSTGVELWQSDGTVAGTTLLRDLRPGAGSAGPDRFTVAGSQLFFRANHDLYGFEPWVSDGTPAGTTVIDVVPGGSSSFPDNLTAASSGVFLSLISGGSIPRLWRSDGTVAGTVSLSAVAAEPRSLTVAGGRLFFSASDAAGREPWTSDGTAAGTFRLGDVLPGAAGSMSPTSGFGVAGSGTTVVFGADDGVRGVEPWISDGTTNGTTLLADLAPDVIGSNPSGYTRVGTDLYFVADDYQHGPELWRLPLAQLQVPLVDTIAAGCAPIGGQGPRLAALGLPVLGNPSFGLRVEGAPPTTFVVTAFDTTPLPVVFAGCTLAFANPLVIVVGASDAAGVQTTSFGIPAATSLLGVILLAQDLVVDANGPGGWFTLSNALRTMIGH